MMKYALCLLALAACGLSNKDHCDTASDCNDGQACLAGVCQPTDHDACGTSRAHCAADASCVPGTDAAACACNAGFTGDGMSCADIDECAAQSSPCADHATCTNSSGSFACACEAGFAGDGTAHCTPSQFTKVAAAGGFSCGLAANGSIYCWGQNSFGALGDGTLSPRPSPLQVGDATDWIDVDARVNVACGLKADHSMWCWGSGGSGQLGDGHTVTEHAPTKVVSDKPGVGWKAMSLGRSFECGLHDDGSAACWGIDRAHGTVLSTPVAVDSNTDWTAIAAGGVACGLRGMPGALYCWGNSSTGMLGLGSVTSQATPARVGTDLWTQVRVGYDVSCGIRIDGALLCWGDSSFSAVLSYGNTPQQVGIATDWQEVSLAVGSIVGLRAGGRAYGWGGNDSGQVAVPVVQDVAQPTLITSPTGSWTHVSAGNVHGCGIANGQIYCWGSIGEGYLGDGRATTLYRPTQVSDDLYSAIASGPGACGIRRDGALMCWGHAFTGVGFGNEDPVWAPTRLGTDTWTSVFGSSGFAPLTCAIRGGQPFCWGDNLTGAAGTGAQSSVLVSPTPVNIPAGTQWTELAIALHACGITSDAKLWCWGNNASSELGTGATSGTPTTAPSAPLAGAWLHVGVSDSDFGDGMTCAIKTDHTLWCWGRDQLPPATLHLVPTQVGSEASWASLSTAATGTSITTCAIKLDGSLWCWGSTLGDGTTQVSATPVRVGGDSDWATVKVGGEVCAVKTGGTLWCWGNSGFVLGNGTPDIFDDTVPTEALAPVQIGTDSDWSTVATDLASETKSCAIKTDGTLWCWGVQAAPVPDIVTTPVLVQ